jgi:hypothetical protein
MLWCAIQISLAAEKQPSPVSCFPWNFLGWRESAYSRPHLLLGELHIQSSCIKTWPLCLCFEQWWKAILPSELTVRLVMQPLWYYIRDQLHPFPNTSSLISFPQVVISRAIPIIFFSAILQLRISFQENQLVTKVRTTYKICGTQSKMKLQGACSKIKNSQTS